MYYKKIQADIRSRSFTSCLMSKRTKLNQNYSSWFFQSSVFASDAPQWRAKKTNMTLSAQVKKEKKKKKVPIQFSVPSD